MAEFRVGRGRAVRGRRRGPGERVARKKVALRPLTIPRKGEASMRGERIKAPGLVLAVILWSCALTAAPASAQAQEASEP